MGRWATVGLLAAVLLGGFSGCGPPQAVELDRPLPSNRFHPVRPELQPKSTAKALTTAPSGG
jgi:hypothetical protein